jgi:hypothetical protein
MAAIVTQWVKRAPLRRSAADDDERRHEYDNAAKTDLQEGEVRRLPIGAEKGLRIARRM